MVGQEPCAPDRMPQWMKDCRVTPFAVAWDERRPTALIIEHKD